MFFTYNNIHSRVRLHYAGNLVFERFSPSEYFYFTPYLITQLQKLAKYKITRDYTFLHRSLPKVWIGYYEGDNGGGTPRLGLSAQETHVFERFSLPEHFACLNLITQLQKLKKIEVFEDFAKTWCFCNYRHLSLDFSHQLQIWTQLSELRFGKVVAWYSDQCCH